MHGKCLLTVVLEANIQGTFSDELMVKKKIPVMLL